MAVGMEVRYTGMGGGGGLAQGLGGWLGGGGGGIGGEVYHPWKSQHLKCSRWQKFPCLLYSAACAIRVGAIDMDMERSGCGCGHG